MPYPQALTIDEVEQFAEEAYGVLTDDIRLELERLGVNIVIEDGPEIFEHPETTAAIYHFALRTIFINGWFFRRASWCWMTHEARERMALTVLHEVAHALGYSHEEMERKGMKLAMKDWPSLHGHTEN